MQFIGRQFLPRENEGSSTNSVDEQLSILIIEDGSRTDTVMCSAIVMHVLQSHCNLPEVSSSQCLLEGPELL